jgi:glycosyltransferase involved in cell wall biosynthesis
MRNELVSICIPSYNGQAYLREALHSAVQQSYPHLEILVVDDGSTDDTVAIVKEFAARYPHVRLVHNTSKGGMVANWVRCIEEARADWIKFLFQDDLLAPNCVEKMIKLCAQTGVDFAFCTRDFIIEANAPQENATHFRLATKPENLFAPGKISPQALARQVVKHGTDNIIGEPVCHFFNRRLLAEAGDFNARFLQLMDYEFALRAAFVKGVAFTPEVLAKFRVHGGSQTSNNTTAKDEALFAKKTIRSIYGDELLLYKTFLDNKHFAIIRDMYGARNLIYVMQFLYLKTCRRFGDAVTRDSLKDVLPQLPEINKLRYNYLWYKIAKHRYKTFQKKKEQL